TRIIAPGSPNFAFRGAKAHRKAGQAFCPRVWPAPARIRVRLLWEKIRALAVRFWVEGAQDQEWLSLCEPHRFLCGDQILSGSVKCGDRMFISRPSVRSGEMPRRKLSIGSPNSLQGYDCLPGGALPYHGCIREARDIFSRHPLINDK